LDRARRRGGRHALARRRLRRADGRWRRRDPLGRAPRWLGARSDLFGQRVRRADRQRRRRPLARRRRRDLHPHRWPARRVRHRWMPDVTDSRQMTGKAARYPSTPMDVVLAVDIGGTKMAVGLMTMAGELIDIERTIVDHDLDADGVFAQLATIVTAQLER